MRADSARWAYPANHGFLSSHDDLCEEVDEATFRAPARALPGPSLFCSFADVLSGQDV
jgi:hypothetical protein